MQRSGIPTTTTAVDLARHTILSFLIPFVSHLRVRGVIRHEAAVVEVSEREAAARVARLGASRFGTVTPRAVREARSS